MPSLDQNAFSAILIALDIALPIVGLLAAVIGLAALFHAERSEEHETSQVLRLVLAGDAPFSAARVIDEHESPETAATSRPAPGVEL